MTARRPTLLAVCAVCAVGTVLGIALPGSASAKDRTTASYDFTGDGRADASVIRFLDNGDLAWFDRGHAAPQLWGNVFEGDVLRPADFDGDGITDPAVVRYGTPMTWFAKGSTGANIVFAFGDSAESDIALTGDIDGDRKADEIVYRPRTPASAWYFHLSSNGAYGGFAFGDSAPLDQPVVADFDGDGRSDVGVQRPMPSGDAEWFVLFSTSGTVGHTVFGKTSDIYVPGDFDGDGAADLTVVRVTASNTYQWFVLGFKGSFRTATFGDATDTPIVGDHDGDGVSDIAVVREGQNAGDPRTWFIWRSGDGGVTTFQYGRVDDYPTSKVELIPS